MGAFNTLLVEYPCSSCSEMIELKIQFKYGETWQYDYCLGEKLKWGGLQLDCGIPGAHKVVVEGYSEKCPQCGAHNYYYIFVVDDVLSAVEPESGLYDFGGSYDGYLILEE